MTSNMTMTAISICDFLKLIVKSTVKHYTEDFKLDIKIFKRYAKEWLILFGSLCFSAFSSRPALECTISRVRTNKNLCFAFCW